ncbi:quinolinate synthetase [Desulfotomaculum arcticum]|uniref:Quinolinate synthase n=1 Tax=Desulfotruncus arcticus DSM 17038 TaxID=1121424 RepID=A0A1I2V432_9FIRM|nr:quinolinate synthase NadA [Desulfotruncus arcticus]SFG84154.1 quinolinate synthetase [Desulfotomaculum arcticum] [Desulfotruncus arcticus DSM 17038]
MLGTEKEINRFCLELSEQDVVQRIYELKAQLGSRLLILGHHYQQDQVIQFADLTGDSFLLSRQAAECKDAQYIVFLGVNFMAETADILTSLWQKVFIPDINAGCIMADMAEACQVRRCWEVLQRSFPGEVIPITYVNSSAEIKAFCGENGGLTCTSSSADGAFHWALEQDMKVLFVPDEHLGRNTAFKAGIDPEEMAVWDRQRNRLVGPENPRVILWNGYCPVHQEFSPDSISAVRKKHPGVRVVVHPECSCETVQAADEAGSTEYIIDCVRTSPAGSVWAVGTEINLVQRLSLEHGDKKIISLDETVKPCPDMLKISPRNLLRCLEGLLGDRTENIVAVDSKTAGWARVALQRMLSIR